MQSLSNDLSICSSRHSCVEQVVADKQQERSTAAFDGKVARILSAGRETVWKICGATKTMFDARRMCSLDAISRRRFRECLPTIHTSRTEDVRTLLLNHCRYWTTSGSFVP